VLEREGPASRELHQVVVQQHLAHHLGARRRRPVGVLVAAGAAALQQSLVKIVSFLPREVYISRPAGSLEVEGACDVALVEYVLHHDHVLHDFLAALLVVVADRVHPQDLAQHRRQAVVVRLGHVFYTIAATIIRTRNKVKHHILRHTYRSTQGRIRETSAAPRAR
jgi:hypothetical protein